MPEPDLGIYRRLNGLIRLVTFPVVFLLLLYSLRRILFSLAAMFIPKKQPGMVLRGINATRFPEILILVPCRNEESMIPGICQALEGLEYPSTRYQVVLIDDGSTDSTRAQMEAEAKDKPGWHVLSLPENRGKASAMNEGLSRFPFGEMVFVFDSDHRPQPEVLKRAVAYFEDERVAGISGRTLPVNPTASPSAYYSTVETYVHQMVTMRAKDRLGLAPVLLGSNCAYRRSTLARCGGFRTGALLEDSELTLAFYRLGFLVRFAEDMVAYHQVPETIDGYVKQHTRWARGFNDVARTQSLSLIRDRHMPLRIRLELVLFTAGYLDRIALVAAGILAILSSLNRRLFRFPSEVFYISLLTPLAQIVALFAEQRAAIGMWLRLPLVPVFFLIDLYSAARAMSDTLLSRRRVWSKTERIPGF